jgi:hypothetical protein
MRFEDLAALVLILGSIAGAVAFYIAWSADLRDLATAAVVLTICVVILAAIAWAIGEVRVERAFATIRTERRPRPALWRYVVPIAVALLAGVLYVVLPQTGRWIWYAFFVASLIVFLWREIEGRRTRSKR